MSLRVRLLSSSRSHLDGVWTHLARVVGFQGLWSPALRADGLYSGGVSLGGGGVLEVLEIPQVASAVRQFIRKRPISRLVSVEVTARDNSAPLSSRSLHEMVKWVSEERPFIVPSLQAEGAPTAAEHCADPSPRPPSVDKQEVGIKGLREIVLAYGEDAGRHDRLSSTLSFVGRSAEGLPDVWQVPCSITGEMVAIRLLPSSLSALVVGVDCLAATREELIKRGVPFESIGVTGASEGHLILASPVLDGLDLRFCENDAKPSIYFNEGTEVMMEGVLEELNPALTRAKAQQGSQGGEGQGEGSRVEYRNKETDGHCWSEFHSQLKRPSGWMKKRQ